MSASGVASPAARADAPGGRSARTRRRSVRRFDRLDAQATSDAVARSFIARNSDLVLAALVVCAVAAMLVPLPTALLDVLLSANIALSLVLLVVAIYVSDAMRIAAFPTILLVATVFRLGLNVSTTRLILARADAGEVVGSFGSFVVADNLVVGVVIFLIITIVQFTVVARGSERVAEVAARFALDAMPGKQMAIDADVRAGLTDRVEAGQQRAALARESQFYGAMDGAMKFVKGDAIAAILITLINLCGGLIVGVAYQGMSADQAASVYAMLAIGDGLVAQLPALLLAVAAGLIVTRVASDDEGGHLGHDIARQVLAHPRAMLVAACLLLALAAVPGLPTVPFLVVAAITAGCAMSLLRGRTRAAAGHVDGATVLTVDAAITPANLNRVRVELAGATTEPGRAEAIAERLSEVRQALYDRLGLLVPAVELRLVDRREPSFRVLVGDVVVDHAGDRAGDHPGDIATRVERALSRRAEELVGMQQVSELLDSVRAHQPALVREVVPALVDLPLLTDVLRRLARERISIRDLPAILHAAAQWARISAPDRRAGDPARLAEHVRRSLRAHITRQYAAENALAAWLLDPLVEDELRAASVELERGPVAALEPELAGDIARSLARAAGDPDAPAILLAAPDVRPLAAELATRVPHLVVLSPEELEPAVELDILGTVGVTG